MAYYDALIAAWNNPTQPPPGVTGPPLTAGMTTDEKITTVNKWTVTGPARQMLVQATVLYNAMNINEYNSLPPANQTIINNILSMGEIDASPNTNVRQRFVQIFPNGTQTFASIATLAKTYDQPQVPWWSANGYPHPISGEDCVQAGLS